VERPRLVERLQTGLAGKLTLIAAPAGFGKTTLVSEWRASDASRDVSIVWVSLDAGDNDVARFWSYIITALDQIEPGVGATALPAQQGIHTSQSASSQPLLEELERANLFLTALDDDRRWYHYHHLFAEVVRTRLTNGMTAAAVAALHRRASTWYEAANMVDAAIDHALAGIDVARAAYLIGQIASLAIQKGELTTLLGWLDALPDDLVRANGELATYKGWVLILMGQTERAESYADAAERGLAVDTTTAVSRGRMLSLLGHLALRRQDSAESLDLATRALQLVGTTDPIFRSLILYTLIQAQRLRGDIAGAIQSMREAIQVDEQLGLSLTPMSYIAVLAVELYWQGRRREAVALWRFRREEF